MKADKIVLTALCAVVCVWTAGMLLGVVNLARHQDVSVPAVSVELSLFLGAGLIPLLAVWVFPQRSMFWLRVAWAPCILYVSFLAINLTRLHPSAGLPRLILWTAIIVLFLRQPRKTKSA